jgi:hypothetical protein
MQWLFTGVLPGEARGFGGVPLAALAIHIATVWQVTGYCTDGDGVKHNHAHPRMAFVTDAERRVSTLYMAIASLEVRINSSRWLPATNPACRILSCFSPSGRLRLASGWIICGCSCMRSE